MAYLAITPCLPDPVAGTDAAGAGWYPVDNRRELAFDHAAILADGVERARSKLESTALATAFCPDEFTIPELQQVYEAVWGARVDPRNFYPRSRRRTGCSPQRRRRRGNRVPAGPPGCSARARRPRSTHRSCARWHWPKGEEAIHDEFTGVILTALDVEYTAVREHLSDPRPHRNVTDTQFEVGRTAEGCRVVMALAGRGNQAVAVIGERAIHAFKPAAILFCGIAGGIQSRLQLGDVIIATHVYPYHGATSTDGGLQARPRALEIQHAADQIAHRVAREAAAVAKDSTVGVQAQHVDEVTVKYNYYRVDPADPPERLFEVGLLSSTAAPRGRRSSTSTRRGSGAI